MITINYSNVFADGEHCFKYRVMIARSFLERGGFATQEDAAWECDKVRLWAGDLCGRRVAYNFPERIAAISDGEYSNPPAEVSQFLAQIRERTGKVPDFESPSPRDGVTPPPVVLTPEEIETQRGLLKRLNAELNNFTEALTVSKFSTKQGEEFLELVHKLQKNTQLALIRLSQS